MERLGMEDGEPIEAKMVTRAIENAQRKVEAHNFDIRKHLLEYDDVMNKQREIVYGRRRNYLDGEDLREEIVGMADEIAESLASNYTNTEKDEEPDWHALDDAMFGQFRLRLNLSEEERDSSAPEDIQERIRRAVETRDGDDANFQVFDTICGATQERQDALFAMMRKPMDLLLVVGGYNSSNTSHLVEIGEQELPTFFIRDAACLKSLETIAHFDLAQRSELESAYPGKLLEGKPAEIGITAGASCPANLIEATILRVFELRGVSREQLESA